MTDRPLPVVYRTTVVRTERLTPHMVRVVVTGPGLDAFPDGGFSDRYVKLIFPRPGVTYPEDMDPAAIRASLPPEQWPVYRTYTIRTIDPRRAELTIDFVTHGDEGVAAPWAAAARPGDELVLTPPGGAYRPSPEVDHHLLVGDAAALPAIASALEDMPPSAAATAIVQVGGPADEILLPTPAEARITWLHSEDPDALVAAVEALEWPAGRVQLFVHGELRAVRAIQKGLAGRGVERELVSLSGYWRRGQDEDGFQAEKRELTAADRAATSS
ncbi:MAG TPA: siderophore-interacting protein [Iamia sp.]|nr:siderophore-interacting protein [Iamia sp.]